MTKHTLAPPKIGLFPLVLLIVAAIDSIRNLPATAIFGSSLIFFFLISAILFLIPISLISADFASRYPEEGGVFHWVRHAFGEKMAVVAVWLQWINTMVWYPTILSFIAGTVAYLFNPELAARKEFLALVILTLFWGLTLLNTRGLHLSAKVNSFCSVLGLLIPMGLLIFLGFFWIFRGNPIQISWELPGSGSWTSLVAIMASFLGMELSGVHVNEIENPKRNFPKALGWAVLILITTMLFGALSIAIVIPKTQIHLVDGIMQTFTLFFRSFHIEWMTAPLALLIVIGSLGGMINWLISPAKGLLQAAHFQFLPPFFAKLNERNVPVRILLAQAILVSLFCLAIILMPSINAFYWFLTDLSTELYMAMYLLLFAAALKLKMNKLSCGLGIVGCLMTIVIGYFPPDGIDVGGAFKYALLIGGGNLILIAPVGLLFRIKKSGRR